MLANDVMTEPDTLVRYAVMWSPSGAGLFKKLKTKALT